MTKFYKGITVIIAIMMLAALSLTACSNKSTSTTTTTQNPRAVAITIISSKNSAVYGDEITFTAAISASSSTIQPTGTVQFSIDGTAFGDPVSLVASSAVSQSKSDIAVGSHTIQAVYSGDTNFDTTETSIVETVNQAAISITIKSSENPSVAGDSVSFTAVVLPTTGTGLPSGTVVFQIDGNDLGSVVTLSGDNIQSEEVTDLTLGAHSVTASYSGDNNFASGQASLSQFVNQTATVPSDWVWQNPLPQGNSLRSTWEFCF